MGDLKEEFLKAGLVDKRAVEMVERKKRAARKRAPNSGRRNRGQSVVATANAGVEHKKAVKDHSPPDRPVAGQEETRQLVISGRIESVSGNRRFYFVDRKGRIPFIELNESAVRGLTNGTFAIVEADDDTAEDYVVVTAATARRLRTLNKVLIRFWNQHE